MKKLSGFLMILFVAGTLSACASQNGGAGSSGSSSGSAKSGEGIFNSSVRK